jgi:hypothetical protein
MPLPLDEPPVGDDAPSLLRPRRRKRARRRHRDAEIKDLDALLADAQLDELVRQVMAYTKAALRQTRGPQQATGIGVARGAHAPR